MTAFIRRHRWLFGLLLCALLGGVGAIVYANRILERVVPGYLGSVVCGKITLRQVEGSLIYGVRLFDVAFHPLSEGKPTVKPVLTIRELRFRYDLVKSLMLRDRYVTVTAVEPRVETDVREILVDPSFIFPLQALLAQHNVFASLEVNHGTGVFTGLPAPVCNDTVTFEANASMTPKGALVWSLPADDAIASYQLRGRFDVATRRGGADLSFTSSHAVRKPIAYAGYSLATPLEGRLSADLSVVQPGVPRPAGAWRVPFGPSLVLDALITGNVVAKAGVLENPAKKLRLVGLSLAASVARSGIRIVDGAVPLAGGKLVATGQIPDWDPARSHLELGLVDARARELAPLLPISFDGTVTGKARIEPGKPVRFALDGTKVQSDTFAFDRARIEGSVLGDRWTIDSLRAESAGGTGVASGVFDVGANRFAFGARFRAFPHGSFKKLLEGFSIQNGLFTGTLTGCGALKPYASDRWTFDFEIDGPTIAGYSGATGVLNGTFVGQTLKVSRLELNREDTWDEARFTVDSSPEQGYKTRGIVRGLRLEKLAPGFTGRVDCGLAIGSAGNEVIELVRGEVRDFAAVGATRKIGPLGFRVGGRRGGAHELEITDRQSFEVTAKLGTLKPTEISPAAIMKKRISGRFKIKDLAPFARLLTVGREGVVSDGQVEGSFQTESREGKLALGAQIDRMRLKSSHGELVASGFKVGYRDGVVSLPAFSGKLKGAPVELAGQFSTAGLLDLSVKVQDLPVTVPLGMSADAPEPVVRPKPAASRTLSLDRPLTLADLEPSTRTVVPKLELDRSRRDKPEESVSGKLRAAARVKGSLESPQIDGDVTLSELSMPGDAEGESSGTFAGKFVLEGQRLVLKGCSLSMDEVGCTVTGSLPVKADLRGGSFGAGEGPVDLVLRLPRTDARILTLLAPTMVSRVSGTVEADLRVGGAMDEPRIDGSFSLKAKSLKTPALPQPVTDLDVALAFNDDTVVVKKLAGRALSGSFTGKGSLPIGEGRPGDSIAVRVAARDMRFAEGPVTLDRLSADLSLTGSAVHPQVGGAVRFEKGLVRIGSGRDGGAGLSPGGLAVPPNVTMNVKVDVPSNLWIRTNQLDAEMKGSIGLQGKGKECRLRGELETVRGNLFFQNRRIRITEGSIKFLRPQREDFLNFTELDDPSLAAKLDANADIPYVSFQGQTAVDTVKIYVDAKGFAVANGVKLSVRSLPPMEESQIVATLVTGKQELSDIEGRDVGHVLTNSLAGQVTHTLVDRQLESAFQKALGFDELRITSNILNVGTAERRAPAVTVGKYLAPNIYVAADGSFDNQSGFFQRFELDLKLDKTLALTVEKALSDATSSAATMFDRTTFSNITANETRLGISKQLKW